MKKLLSTSLVFVLFVTLLVGCGAKDGTFQNAGKLSESAAEKVPEWTQEKLQAYLARESEAEMSAAGPFYFGSFDGYVPESEEYSQARSAKVDEIIGVMDGSIEILGELDKKLRAEKEIFAWYIGEIAKIDKTSTKWTENLLNATDLGALSSALSNVIVIKNQADARKKDVAWGFLQFQKYGALVDLIDLYGWETGGMMGRAVALYYLLETDSNPAYKDLNTQFIAKMDPLSDEASELVNQLYAITAQLHFGQKQLFTADYQFIKATLTELDKQLAAAKKSFDEYQGTNEIIKPELLAILKQKLTDLEAKRTALSAYIDSIPSTALLTEQELTMADGSIGSFFIPVASAQMDIPGWFQQKVTDAVKTVKSVKNLGMAAIRVTGQGIKDLYDKSGAHEVVKDGGQIINGGIEIINSTVEVGVKGAQDIYWGDFSWKNFKAKIDSEKNELYDKFVQGKLGKEQMDEMIKQLDTFKHNTDTFVKNMSGFSGFLGTVLTGEKKVGDFVEDVTKNVGNEAKGALDTATDFSKSLAVVLHPDSTKQQTREALLDIFTKLQETKDKKGKDVEVEIPDLVDLTKKELGKQAGIEIEDEEEAGDEEKEDGEEGEDEDDGGLLDQIKDAIKDGVSDEFKGEETDDGSKPPTKPDAETKDTGTTTEDKETSESTANTSPAAIVADAISKNPDMTDQEIRDLIIGEITKGLPTGDKDDEAEATEAPADTDADGVNDVADNCDNDSNADQKDTDNDGIGDACDPDCSGDVDSDALCNELDNCPQQANADQADADKDLIGNVCDDDAPLLSEIAGSWPGSITITDVEITPEFRAQAKESGCDIEEIEKSKGQVKPISMTINPTSETGGTIVMGVEGEDNKTIPFTYADGKLSASMAEEGAALDFNMSFTAAESKGSMNMDYLGGIKLKADMNLKK